MPVVLLRGVSGAATLAAITFSQGPVVRGFGVFAREFDSGVWLGSLTQAQETFVTIQHESPTRGLTD